MSAPYNETELEVRKKILENLLKELSYHLRIGEISQAEYQRIKDSSGLILATSTRRFGLPKYFTYSLDELETKGNLPYADFITLSQDDYLSHIKDLETVVVTQREQKGFMEKYLPSLNAQNISPVEKQRKFEEVNRAFQLGLSPSQLPEYNETQSYWRNTGQMPQLLEEQNQRGLQQYYQLRENQGQQAAQGMQGMFGGLQQRYNQQPQQDMANQWDAIKGDILGNLQSPVNWIQKWQIENAVNPYNMNPPDLGQRIEQLRAESEQYGKAAKDVQSKLSNPNNRLTLGGIANPQTSEEQWAATVLAANENAQQQLNELEAERATEVGMWEAKGFTSDGGIGPGDRGPVVRQETPNAPDWMVKYVPGLTAGQPITKQRMATPSPQQWRTTPSIQQQMLQGYTEWQGTSWADIAQQYQNMLPANPNIAYQWQPQRQRV